jgi:prepilin-type N-terminal cleavage/methylation domain-containing protein/prepilin-type processing-associated H-X9-DG protein
MHTKNAFTLIELLVVIAIIAILASILFPVFAQAKMASKKTVSLTNAREIGVATMLYDADYDDRAVPLFYFGDPTSTLPVKYFPVLLLPYTKNEQIFVDPTDTQEGPAEFGSRFSPSNPYHALLLGTWPSYGYNYRYLNTRNPDFSWSGNPLSAIDAPASTVLFAEASSQGVIDPQTCVETVSTIGYAKIDPPSKWQPGVAVPPGCSGTYKSYLPAMQGHLFPRYSSDNSEINVTWLDGHAKRTPMGKLKGTGSTAATQDIYFNGKAN